jgi:hypothetical protein
MLDEPFIGDNAAFEKAVHAFAAFGRQREKSRN